ncbi:MAG: alginate export family protein [Candidatus Sericytochromatia bacterium]
MSHRLLCAVCCSLSLLLTLPVTAQELSPPALPSPAVLPSPTPSASPDPDAWHFGGQVLVRTEMDNRDFDPLTSPLFWTVMRTRLNVGKSLFDRQLEFYLQIQDARTFGDVGAAIGNLRNLDLYQGYVQANRLLGQDLALQVGRFELDYGNGRLFNPLPGWNYIGESFDGGRLKYRRPDWFNLSVDAFAAVIKNTTPAIRNPTPTAYALTGNPGHALYGAWATADFAPEAKVDAFGYYEIDNTQTTPGKVDVSRWTLGLNHRGKYLDGLLSSTLEADLQTGQLGALSSNGYLLSASAFAHPGEFHVGLGADLVSGNNPTSTTTNNAFSQAFGNNHAFYGYMDYFLNVPVNSKNLGLNDAYLKSSWTPTAWPIEVALDLHHLSANQSASNGQSIFGQEADFTVTYKQGNNKYIWGLSGFLPGGLFTSDLFFGSSRSQPAVWSYLQAIINF